MHRTVISLTENDNAWLDERAQHEHISKTEIIRRALALYRKMINTTDLQSSLAATVEKTRGLLKLHDGLEFQEKIRKEWENRS